MKRFLTLLLVMAVVLPLSPRPDPLEAQSWRGTLDAIAAGTTVSAAITTDDTDVALLVKYVGDSTAADVAVDAATGDLTFRQAAAADTTLECPVSGALGGIIDVSDAACNTLGEVVDEINKSAEWRAVILDGFRTDSSNDSLLTIAATDATLEDGLALKWDTDTVGFAVSRALTTARTIKPYIAGRPQQGASFVPNPFRGTRTIFWYGNATSTYASGTSQFTVTSVKVENNSGTVSSKETATTVLGPIAGGATTANKEFDFRHVGIPCNPDEKCVVRLKNSAAMASVTLVASGTQYKYP